MEKSIILLLVYLILLGNHAKAQTFTNYTATNTSTTLCAIQVTAIAIDSQGNKWFGTDRGVSKFDGTNYTTYTTEDGLASNDVRAIARTGIALLNVFLGWTLIGWVVALVWAVSACKEYAAYTYICSKCGYKHGLDQKVKIHVCPQCKHETLYESN